MQSLQFKKNPPIFCLFQSFPRFLVPFLLLSGGGWAWVGPGEKQVRARLGEAHWPVFLKSLLLDLDVDLGLCCKCIVRAPQAVSPFSPLGGLLPSAGLFSARL